ncbi:MAG TPA: hypothetical protein ENH82_08715 [bacterium]|nr:hypothetical protein [bacterium]
MELTRQLYNENDTFPIVHRGTKRSVTETFYNDFISVFTDDSKLKIDIKSLNSLSKKKKA